MGAEHLSKRACWQESTAVFRQVSLSPWRTNTRDATHLFPREPIHSSLTHTRTRLSAYTLLNMLLFSDQPHGINHYPHGLKGPYLPSPSTATRLGRAGVFSSWSEYMDSVHLDGKRVRRLLAREVASPVAQRDHQQPQATLEDNDDVGVSLRNGKARVSPVDDFAHTARCCLIYSSFLGDHAPRCPLCEAMPSHQEGRHAGEFNAMAVTPISLTMYAGHRAHCPMGVSS